MIANKSVQAKVRQTISLHIAELLQVSVEQLDLTKSFLEQGADSIILMEAMCRIEKIYGVRISMQQIFEDFPSVEALTMHLTAHSQLQAEAATMSQRKSTSASQSAISIMQAQLQLITHTIEQQNRLLRHSARFN